MENSYLPKPPCWPRGTPPDVLATLNEATNRCRNDSAYVTRMNTMNVTLTTSKPSDVALWAERDSQSGNP